MPIYRFFGILAQCPELPGICDLVSAFNFGKLFNSNHSSLLIQIFLLLHLLFFSSGIPIIHMLHSLKWSYTTWMFCLFILFSICICLKRFFDILSSSQISFLSFIPSISKPIKDIHFYLQNLLFTAFSLNSLSFYFMLTLFICSCMLCPFFIRD